MLHEKKNVYSTDTAASKIAEEISKLEQLFHNIIQEKHIESKNWKEKWDEASKVKYAS